MLTIAAASARLATGAVLGLVLPLPGLAFGQEQQELPALTGIFADAPAGFIPPPIHPRGAQLETHKLDEGVYALIATPVNGSDNSGFIIGERGVLVVDSHINGEMAQQILDAVRRVTEKPILYLVNTNYHGDHTFGNYRFPATTRIIAHRATAERMLDFEHEKALLLPLLGGDADLLKDVRPRLPDIVFDHHLRLDLGGRVVELYYFGPANTPGDVFVYQPDAKVAFSGNVAIGSFAAMFEVGAATYLATIARLKTTLDVETFVPGHLGPKDGSILNDYAAYLGALLDAVRTGIRDGKGPEELYTEAPLDSRYIPPGVSDAFVAFLHGLHRMNVLRTYQEEMGSQGGGRRSPGTP